MDEASVALKVGDVIDEGAGLVGVGAAGVAAGMRVAPTYMEAPRFLLHSMRQCQRPDCPL